MTVVRADWVCPISQPPIRDGWVAFEDGCVTSVGDPGEPPPAPPRDLGHAALLPGLVNAHTHLELSSLRGRVPPAADFIDWIKQLFAVRGAPTPELDADARAAVSAAAREMRECGTAAVGDVSNSLASTEAIRAAGLRGIVFHELLGFNVTDGQSVIDTRPRRLAAAALGRDAVRVSVAPHAPYSVSAELFRAIRDEVNRSSVPITTVHVGESAGEMDLLRDGSGPWPAILRVLGVARPGWTPVQQGPIEYLDAIGVLDARTLVVHGVQLRDESLRRLAQLGCTLVTCPRSNQWVGVGAPPVARFYAAGVKVAVGTDSLASVEDLNLFSELRTMRWLAPDVPARTLLESATKGGAEALGLGDELGTIEAGKRVALIAVSLGERRPVNPPGTKCVEPVAEDVEEFLLRGIDPSRISWVAA